MNKAKSQPVTDPRLLKIAEKFRCMDDRGKELLYRQALSMPCAKVPA